MSNKIVPMMKKVVATENNIDLSLRREVIDFVANSVSTTSWYISSPLSFSKYSGWLSVVLAGSSYDLGNSPTISNTNATP